VSSRKTNRTQKHCRNLTRPKQVDASFSALGQGHSTVRTTTIPACDESNLRLCFELFGRVKFPRFRNASTLVTGRDEYAADVDALPVLRAWVTRRERFLFLWPPNPRCRGHTRPQLRTHAATAQLHVLSDAGAAVTCDGQIERCHARKRGW
jgi:hypothetical protein